jgi:uncharacterized protein (TIGR02246 family)
MGMLGRPGMGMPGRSGMGIPGRSGMGMPGRSGMGMRSGSNRDDHFDHHHDDFDHHENEENEENEDIDFIFIGSFGFPWWRGWGWGPWSGWDGGYPYGSYGFSDNSYPSDYSGYGSGYGNYGSGYGSSGYDYGYGYPSGNHYGSYYSGTDYGNDDESAVRNVLAEYADSWNRHDMAALGRLFTENCDYVNIAGVHWNGVQEIVQRQGELFQNRLKTAVETLTGAEVRFPTSDVALVHATWDLTGGSRPTGEAVPVLKEITTMVMVKTNGKWLITAFQNTENWDSTK